MNTETLIQELRRLDPTGQLSVVIPDFDRELRTGTRTSEFEVVHVVKLGGQWVELIP